MLKKVSFVLLLAALFSSCLAKAQVLGDFRSAASGNWNSAASWQSYNGTSWIAAVTYPGQNLGTNNVYIRGGHSITITSTVPNAINSLTVGDGSGAIDNFLIGGTAILNTQLITIANGGSAEWIANVSFYLPSGAAFVIESGGVLVVDKPCNAAKRLVIGTVIYSTCNGGAGADYSFKDLNDQGGSLSVAPTSNSPICQGSVLTLFANPTGTGASGASFVWSGTGPSGYSYSSISKDPTISGLVAGTYTFTVTATGSSGNTNTKSIGVTVNATPTLTTHPSNVTVMDGANTSFVVAATNANTYQWQISINSGATFTNVLNGGVYSGANTNTLLINPAALSMNGYQYRALISNSGYSCGTAITSNAAVLNVRVRKMISNKRITYRAKKN